MSIVVAQITDDARRFYLRSMGGFLLVPGTPTSVGDSIWDHRFKFFRVGEGGWTTSGMSTIQRTAVSNLRRYDNNVQDIDARVDGTRAGAGQPVRYEGNTASADYSRGFFQKNLGSGSIQMVEDRRMRVDCLLAVDEFNEDSSGSGRNPVIWEVGLFADHPEVDGESLMVAYGTMPAGLTKRAGEQLPIRLYITL